MNIADFRRIALSMEGAEEASHMGAPDFRVGGHIFATLASHGNLMLTPEQQAAFVEELPQVFIPVAGGWGRMGATHVDLSKANEEILTGAIRVAWMIRVEKNKGSKNSLKKAEQSLPAVAAQNRRAKVRTVKSLIESYPEDVQALASKAKQFVQKLLPKLEEHVDPSAPVIAYGYGTGYRGMVCTLILSKSGVKLGLVRGSEFPDPHQLMEGSGKVHRYVQLHTAADLRKAGLKQLIEAAHNATLARQSSVRTQKKARKSGA